MLVSQGTMRADEWEAAISRGLGAKAVEYDKVVRLEPYACQQLILVTDRDDSIRRRDDTRICTERTTGSGEPGGDLRAGDRTFRLRSGRVSLHHRPSTDSSYQGNKAVRFSIILHGVS